MITTTPTAYYLIKKKIFTLKKRIQRLLFVKQTLSLQRIEHRMCKTKL